MSLHDALLAKALGGGGSGVSSWNDLTDKPFNIVELMPETQFAYNGGDGSFVAQADFEFVSGRTYIVNWNGVEYTATAKTAFYNNMSVIMVGNPVVAGGEDNGLPFVVGRALFTTSAKGYIMAIPLDGSTSVSIGFKGVESSALYDNSNTFLLDARGSGENQNYTFELETLYATPDQIYTALAGGKKVAMLVPVYESRTDGMLNIIGMEEIPLAKVFVENGVHGAFWFSEENILQSGYAIITRYNDDGTYVPAL